MNDLLGELSFSSPPPWTSEVSPLLTSLSSHLQTAFLTHALQFFLTIDSRMAQVNRIQLPACETILGASFGGKGLLVLTAGCPEERESKDELRLAQFDLIQAKGDRTISCFYHLPWTTPDLDHRLESGGQTRPFV